MRPTISLCMIVKNEALLLRQCLESIKEAANEIIIVDGGSTDRTVKIAKQCGARILFDRSGNLAKARNRSIKEARGAWILVLDADERIAKKDLFALQRLTKQDYFLGYRLPVRNYTKGQDLLWQWFLNDGQYPQEERFSQCPGYRLDPMMIRLFRNGAGLQYDEDFLVHEQLSLSPKQKKRIGDESHFFIHHFQYLKGGNRFILKKQRQYLVKQMKMIGSEPKFAHIHLNVAKTFFRFKKDAKAMKHLRKAIKLNPGLKEGYFLMGVVLKEFCRYQDAMLNLKHVLKLDSRCADAWTMLGIIYERLGKFQKAEEALKRAIQFRFLHPGAHNSLGIVYQNQGKFQQAAKSYQTAIKIHPEHSDAFYNLGTLYENNGKWKEARKLYQRSLVVNPDDVQSKLCLADLLR